LGKCILVHFRSQHVRLQYRQYRQLKGALSGKLSNNRLECHQFFLRIIRFGQSHAVVQFKARAYHGKKMAVQLRLRESLDPLNK
jgi:hypothetical protein